MFSYIEKTDNSPRKKSNSKSPTRKNSGIPDNNGDFSPLLCRMNRNKNSPDFMTSSIGNFANPLIFPGEDNVFKEMTAEQFKINKRLGNKTRYSLKMIKIREITEK